MKRRDLLAARLRTALGAIPGVRVLDRGAMPCAIVTMTADGRHADSIVRALKERRINTVSSLREFGIYDFDAKGIETAVAPSVWRDVLEQVQLSPEERRGCLRPVGPESRRTLRLWGRIAAKEAARRLLLAEGEGPTYPADWTIEPDRRGLHRRRLLRHRFLERRVLCRRLLECQVLCRRLLGRRYPRLFLGGCTGNHVGDDQRPLGRRGHDLFRLRRRRWRGLGRRFGRHPNGLLG